MYFCTYPLMKTVSSSCLTKAGYTIGTYKSPHVHTFAERIRVKGRYNDKELSELFEQILKKRTDLETNDVQKEEEDASTTKNIGFYFFTYEWSRRRLSLIKRINGAEEALILLFTAFRYECVF